MSIRRALNWLVASTLFLVLLPGMPTQFTAPNGPPPPREAGQATGGPPYAQPLLSFADAFVVTDVFPANGARDIARRETLSATFNQDVDWSTVTTHTFTVRGETTGGYEGLYSPGSVRFRPGTEFDPGEEIVVNLSSGLHAADGSPLSPYAWQFFAATGASCGLFYDSNQTLGSTRSMDVALGDLDGDGDLDAFVTNGAGRVADYVWVNDGTGTFTDSGQRLGDRDGRGIALGDLDSDGDLDAYVTNAPFDGGGAPDQVWLNDGTGHFTDSGQNLGNTYGMDVALGDLDGDGDLDAFVANGWNYEPIPNKVWLNDGHAIFTDSGQNLGAASSQAVALGDLDGDGDQDAFVGNYWAQPNEVWLNDGAAQFSDSGQRLGAEWTLDVALGDMDGDGDLDAFVSNTGEPNATYNTVWRNNGSGVFVDSGQRLGNGNMSSHGVHLGDLDGDGDLDAFAAIRRWGCHVWLNNGAGVFSSNGQALGTLDSYAVMLGDLDGDTDLDAFVVNHDYPGGEPAQVYMNYATPIADLEATNNSPTPLGSITRLVATVSADCNVRFEWDLGDGTFGRGATISHLYPAVGVYTAVVTVSNSMQVLTATTIVTVTGELGEMQATNDGPTVLGQVTTLTATVPAGGGVLYRWALGDGTSCSGAFCTHIYPAVGSYTALVTASFQMSEVTATTVVIVAEAITGLQAANDSPTALGQLTAFTATVLSGTAPALAWSFGDGTHGGGAYPAHLYAAEGVFTAVVTASNPVSVLTATTIVTVTRGIIGLQATNNSPTALGQVTTLTATVAAGSGVQYHWALGDGTLDSGASFTHTYPAVGSYTALVTASNDVGRVTATTSVVVFCQPVEQVTVLGPTSLLVGESGTLTATWSPLTTTQPLAFAWDNGVRNPVAVYSWTAPGIYTPIVTVTNSCGQIRGALSVQVVLPRPWLAFLPLILVDQCYAPDLTVSAVNLDPQDPATLKVVIANQGTSPALSFWIDGYLDPVMPPEVNYTWLDLGCPYGLAWFVDFLAPGDVLTLTVGGPYFQADYSRWPDEYPSGGHEFWALVDSWGPPQPYGAVHELDEENNRYGPITFTGSGQPPGDGHPIPERPRRPATAAP